MATTSSVSVSSATDVYGNSYTTAISNDSLSSDDFIQLMLTELQNQDPTNPTDSSQMLSNQLQLNSLQTNIAMTEAMQTLSSSFQQTAISSASNLINSIVENGTTNSDGDNKQYLISSVGLEDGEINLKGYEITDIEDTYTFGASSSANDLIANAQDENDNFVFTTSDGMKYTFSTTGKTYQNIADEVNTTTGLSASITQTSDGLYQLYISNSGGKSSITQNGTNLSITKSQGSVVSSTATTIAYSEITNIY